MTSVRKRNGRVVFDVPERDRDYQRAQIGRVAGFVRADQVGHSCRWDVGSHVAGRPHWRGRACNARLLERIAPRPGEQVEAHRVCGQISWRANGDWLGAQRRACPPLPRTAPP